MNIIDKNKEKKFYKEMTVGEALEAHPLAGQVFMAFHLGGCSHCAISPEETIEEVCDSYGIPIEMFLEELNSLSSTSET